MSRLLLLLLVTLLGIGGSDLLLHVEPVSASPHPQSHTDFSPELDVDGSHQGPLLLPADETEADVVAKHVPTPLPLARPSVERILQRGTLVVLTRESPTTYQLDDKGRPRGFEYDLARSFANHLGLEVRFKVYPNQAAVLDALRRGAGDLAAAGLATPPVEEREFLHGPVYQEVDFQVVCRRGGPQPRTLRELSKVMLLVPADTAAAERLQQLQRRVPNLSFKTEAGLSFERALRRVQKGNIDCTVADSHVVAVNRRYLPELVVMFSVDSDRTFSWALSQDAEGLAEDLSHWHERMVATGGLDHLYERYFGFVPSDHEAYDYAEHRSFLSRIDERLPRFLRHFREAERRYKVSWSLLAAQAYQESRWDADALSPTGVRGIMQLTRNTARELGVENRDDPRASILGGARYLTYLRDRLPSDVREPDRTWMALAAYNAGLVHVQSARQLAITLGKNPNQWKDVREVFPLLDDQDIARTLNHSRLRGDRVVDYVQQIRHLGDVLHYESRTNPILVAALSGQKLTHMSRK
ncbi:MAG: membrane-bound lytic murein transglycosylase MltF [Magnetococcus sp. WYHC-3]